MPTTVKFECKGKHPYNNRDEAQADIYLRIAESQGGVIDLRAYKCRYCKKWHLTSTPH